MSTDTSNDRKQWVEERIRRTVAASTLKQIRRLVNEHEAEDHFARRFSRIVLWSLAALVLALAVMVAMFGLAPITRSLSGATGTAPRTPVITTPVSRSAPAPLHVGRAGTGNVHAARYVEDWNARIESHGNAHFSQALDEKGIYGSAVVTTVIRADGTLDSVQIVKSSGFHELDATLRALIGNAAPFAPFPDSLKQDVDVLHITRTFAFEKQAKIQK